MCYAGDDRYLDAKIDLKYASPIRGTGRDYETSAERTERLAIEAIRKQKSKRQAAEVKAIANHGFELKDAYIEHYLHE